MPSARLCGYGRNMDPQEIFSALIEPDGMADPYPLYAALHQLGEVIQADSGMVLVPGYEAASAVLRDPRYLVPDAERLDQMYPGLAGPPGAGRAEPAEPERAAAREDPRADGAELHLPPGPVARAGDRAPDGRADRRACRGGRGRRAGRFHARVRVRPARDRDLRAHRRARARPERVQAAGQEPDRDPRAAA